MGIALPAFANKHLESLYFCSDPNNFNLVSHNRRPSQGNDIFTFGNPFLMGSPWRYLSPSYTAAHETPKRIALDCALFWSEIASALPYLHKWERLDCGLALLLTEAMFPYELEWKQQAGHHILDTCLNNKVSIRNKIALKDYQDKG